MCCLSWSYSTNSWQFKNIPSDYILKGSKICVKDQNQIFYVRSEDKKIGNYWNNGSSWGYSALNTSSVRALNKAKIIYSNDQVFYIGEDLNIHAFYWNGCKWNEYTLNESCLNSTLFPNLALGKNEKIYYVENNRSIEAIEKKDVGNFVYTQGNKLKLKGNDYTPIAVNYVVDLYTLDSTNFFYGPHAHYDNYWEDGVCNTSGGCSDLLDIHFQDISNLGFNAIRFNGITVGGNPKDLTDSSLYISSWHITPPLRFQRLVKKVDTNFEPILLKHIEDLIEKCRNYNLKVNYFIGLGCGNISNHACHNTYKKFLTRVAKKFRYNDNINLYSILLEPDASNNITDKGYICSFVNDCYNNIRKVDSNHLVTVGLSNAPFSTFNWDPGIFNVDVLTFHPYPFNIDDYSFQEVKRHMKWMSNIMQDINKPWIIGETGYPGTSYEPYPKGSTTGTPQTQRKYAEFAINNTFTCGGSGFSWWQYHDVYWPSSFESHLGLYEHNGEKKDIIKNNVFKNFKPKVGCGDCISPADYYDVNNNRKHKLKGYIKDNNGNPIKDAVILGRESWSKGLTYTFSQSNGYFELKTDYKVSIMQISAIGKERKDIFSVTSFNNIILNDQVCSPQQGVKKTFLNISEEVDKDIIEVYPNPTKEKLFVKGENISTVQIYNTLGQKIIHYNNNKLNLIELSLFNKSKGLYIVQIILTTGEKIHKKILVE